MQVRVTAYRRGEADIPFDLAEGEILVGRSAVCDIHLNDSYVSRKHCRLLLSAETLKVIDLLPTHGTYVNDQRIREAELTDGDRLRIGRVYLDVKIGRIVEIETPANVGRQQEACPAEATNSDEDARGLPAGPPLQTEKQSLSSGTDARPRQAEQPTRPHLRQHLLSGRQ